MADLNRKTQDVELKVTFSYTETAPDRMYPEVRRIARQIETEVLLLGGKNIKAEIVT